MKKSLLFFSLFISMISVAAQHTSSFKSQQQRYERVRTAYSEKENAMLQVLKDKNIEVSSMDILLRAYKQESELELWAKNKKDKQYTLLKTYKICASSGTLGPKRKQGDIQVPEGFYVIDRFNPVSNFYLSLGVSYPNASDKILGVKGALGGDIFIHGNCVTIGCLPISDDK